MINIAKLLKGCPKGTKLYSPLFGEVQFRYIDDSTFGIIVEDFEHCSRSFDKYGRYFTKYNNAECLLFPSKDYRTWNGWTPCVEPKFKVGDFIADNYCKGKVIELTNDAYLLDTEQGIPFSCEHNIHLWTIQDAKDGDVLIDETTNTIGIFEKIYGIHWHSKIYCGNSTCATVYHDGGSHEIKSTKPATKEQCNLFFSKINQAGYEWDADKKEVKKIEPKFKVGDWVVKKDGETFYGGNYAEQITLIEIDEKGKCIWFSSKTWAREDDIRLWTIQDAKDGDVLTLNGKPFIYSHKYGKNYCYIDDCGQFRVNFSLVLEGNCVCPATKQERDLLFSKMRNVGYEWDADKKELRKIKPHYDISNFHAGMPVLVRDYNNTQWRYVQFSHCVGKDNPIMFNACGNTWEQCIPYEGNEHLLGTTEPCGEEYINW